MQEVTGTLDHRLLLNYRVDPEVMQRQLPDGFRPKLVGGHAIAGICQVTLSRMRPKGMPKEMLAGAKLQSHNVAHRIAVVTAKGEGVYVPRRDTSSWLNAFTGGRLFPGAYHKSNFDVRNEAGRIRVDVKARDGRPLVSADATVTDALTPGSTFADLDEVSAFFQAGNLGWSPRPAPPGSPDRLGSAADYDAIEFAPVGWSMEPMQLAREFSAYYSDESKFPKGSVQFDCALLMRNLEHSWIVRDPARGLN